MFEKLKEKITDKKNFNKKYFVFGGIVLCILISLSAVCYYYFNRIMPYYNALNTANKDMSLEQYDKAITSYQEALKYRSNPNIDAQINNAKILKDSKDAYDTAMKEMDARQYLEAIETFKKVDKQDIKRCSDSQN